jgi:hypothetical protein
MDDIYTDENEIIQEEVEEDTENPSTGDVSIENILACVCNHQLQLREGLSISSSSGNATRAYRKRAFKCSEYVRRENDTLEWVYPSES